MLAKKYRLPVQSVIGKNGKEMRFLHFLFKLFPSALPYSRFGVVLKKGMVKKAADRNLLRRIIFDAVRKSGFAVSVPNRDVLIIVGKSALDLDSKILGDQISAAISGIMK